MRSLEPRCQFTLCHTRLFTRGGDSRCNGLSRRAFAMPSRVCAGSYERKLATLARIPLVIIDDLGLKPLSPLADEDYHALIAERYEQTTTIMTSNLDF